MARNTFFLRSFDDTLRLGLGKTRTGSKKEQDYTTTLRGRSPIAVVAAMASGGPQSAESRYLSRWMRFHSY